MKGETFTPFRTENVYAFKINKNLLIKVQKNV